ncbi:methyltransferase domain-containing protein [Rhodobacterales bacterium HKCCE3408]|nr:methyltransferase domain-containing protein [Rhodobacterales bacterium HKCCE3408]
MTTSTTDGLPGHYGTGGILERIDAGLREIGVDPAHPDIDALKPVDEFHIGGLEATSALLDQLQIGPETLVVDFGCGLGGTARHIVHRYGSAVHGIDLTPEFVETGQEINTRLGLGERITLEVGSILDAPIADDAADLVTLLHVGMNIADKQRLFAEAARVLKPGGIFAVFDIMERDGGGHDFPVPWASTPDQSHVARPEVYREAAAAAGLTPVTERDRWDFAVEFFTRVVKASEESGPPPIGLHLLMGENARDRYMNVVRATQQGVVGPWEMIFRKAPA